MTACLPTDRFVPDRMDGWTPRAFACDDATTAKMLQHAASIGNLWRLEGQRVADVYRWLIFRIRFDS